MDDRNRDGREFKPWVNYILIAIHAAVFVLGLIPGLPGGGGDAVYRRGALYAPLILKGQGFYRLLTSVFLHADAAHLTNNMIVQFAGGEIAEKNLGHARYLLVYLLSGIGGNALSVLSDHLTGEYGFSVGASGAVFGVIGTILFLILREAFRSFRSTGIRRGTADPEAYTQGKPPGKVYSPRLKSLLIRAAVMTAWLLYSGARNPSVNQAAHVGGLATGFILSAVLMPGDRSDLGQLL